MRIENAEGALEEALKASRAAQALRAVAVPQGLRLRLQEAVDAALEDTFNAGRANRALQGLWSGAVVDAEQRTLIPVWRHGRALPDAGVVEWGPQWDDATS